MRNMQYAKRLLTTALAVTLVCGSIPMHTPAATKSAAKPSITSVTSKKAGQVTVKWKKVSGIQGYQVSLATDKGFKQGKKTATLKGIKTTSKTISGLKAGKKYYVHLRTFYKGNCYGKWSKTIAVKAGKKTIIKWGKIAGVDGYQISIATDKKFKKNKKTISVPGAKKTSKTLTNLKSGKKYYVRVRTYTKGTKYGAWSATRSIKIAAKKKTSSSTNTAISQTPAKKPENANNQLQETNPGKNPPGGYDSSQKPNTSGGTTSETNPELEEPNPDKQPSNGYDPSTDPSTSGGTTGGSGGLEDPYPDKEVPGGYFVAPTIDGYHDNQNGTINIRWNAVDGVSGYELQFCKNDTFNANYVYDTTDCSLNNIDPFSEAHVGVSMIVYTAHPQKFWARLRAYSGTGNNKKYTGWSKVLNGVVSNVGPNTGHDESESLQDSYTDLKPPSGYEATKTAN